METIKSRREFELVFRGGRRANHRLVRLTAYKDCNAKGKVAFVAAKRLGNAVYRNRCKRVLREAARQCGLPYQGCKVILFATKATHGSAPAEVAAILPHLMDKVANVKR